MVVRPYRDEDYQGIIALYKQGDLYGGQFDADRDSKERLNELSTKDPQSILVYESKDEILGTVSLIENGRVAWLFRFAVQNNEFEKDVTDALYNEAVQILKQRGHDQVLVYSPVDNTNLDERYENLGMNKGNPYTCFWSEIG